MRGFLAVCPAPGGAPVSLVKDEDRLAAWVRDGLEAEGFAVDVALNGVDGLWLTRENNYDAIVLAIQPRPAGQTIFAVDTRRRPA